MADNKSQYQSLARIDTVGAGEVATLIKAVNGVSMFVKRASTGAAGGSTSASVRLQGSFDKSNWINLGAAQTINSVTGTAYKSTGFTYAVPYLRINVVSFTTSTTLNPDKVKLTGTIIPHSV